MSTTLQADSFNDINIKERSVLTQDVLPGVESIVVQSNEGYANGDVIYVGQLSREGIEKAVVQAVSTDGKTLTLVTALVFAHSQNDPVTSVVGDHVRIYRAPNVDGSVPADEAFDPIAEREIDADDTSTYYRDPVGSSAYWYRLTYFNPDSEAETALSSSRAVRGDDFGHYASISEIRAEAGFQNAYNLKDSLIDQQRRAAENEINSKLSAQFKTPFDPVPEAVHSLTIKLAAALLKQQSGVSNGDATLKAIRTVISDLAAGDGSITDDMGTDLTTSEAVSYDFGDEPRMFSVRQKF